MKQSKIILGVAVWLLVSAVYALWVVASAPGPLGSSEKLQNLVGVVVSATVAIGLFRHRRWAMWLYFVLAAAGVLALLTFGPGTAIPTGQRTLATVLGLVAILLPAILIWLRRDRLGPAPAERSNA